MSRRGRIVVVASSVIAVVLAATTFGLFHERGIPSQGEHVQSLRGAESNNTGQDIEEKKVSAPSRPQQKNQRAPAVEYLALFNSSKNYLEFARAAIGPAKAGNADAAFYLGKALSFCDVRYRELFFHNYHEVSLEEALALHPADQRSASIARSVYQQCHDLSAVKNRETEFGKAGEWIKSAASQGQPGAQSIEAINALQQKIFASTAEADKSTSNDNGDPLALLQTAVESKDPEALIAAGYAQGLINQSFSDKMLNQFAWWLVGCNRGMDCSINSNFMQQICQTNFCLDDLPARDTICMLAGSDCQAIEQRAQAIEDKIDAGAWDQLGFQSGQSSS